MADNNDVEYFKSLFYSPTESTIDVLEMLSIIDIGIILDVDANGRASVKTSKVSNGEPFILTDIEVLGFGNRNGAFTVNGCGCTCLLFAPRTHIPDVRDMGIDITTPPFSNVGIKALPISNGRGLFVNAYFNSEGTFVIDTGNYQLSFAQHRVFYKNSGMCIKITDDSYIYLYRRNKQSGIFELTLDDGGFTTSFTNTDGDSRYTFAMIDDGSLSIRHVKPGSTGSQDEELNVISVSKEGALTISASDKLSLTIGADGSISLESKGNISVKGSSINFNGGNLEIAGE